MKWNRKGIIICTAFFFVLLCFLIGKAMVPVSKQTQDRDSVIYASEEEVVFPMTATGMGIGQEEETAVSGREKAEKQTVQPQKTAPVPTPKQPVKKTAAKKDKPKAKEGKKRQYRENTPQPSTEPVVTAEPTKKQEVSAVTFEIECTAIMEHRNMWKEGIEEIVPASGYFYRGEQEISEGETVYDVLKRICSRNKIALDAEYTPIYGTYYIKGIGNLYEFDCGSESGWQYKVNDVLDNTGCSSYVLKKGDRVSFFYDYQYGE